MPLDLRGRGRGEPTASTRRRTTATSRRASASPTTCSAIGRTILRTGFGITYFPEQPSASQPARAVNVPYTISQNVSHETNPLDCRTRADDRQPVPADRAGEAADDGGADQRPTRACSATRFENETPYAEQWHLGHRAPAVLGDGRGARVRRQRRQAPRRSATTRTKCSRVPGSQASRRLHPAARDLSTTWCSAIRATARPSTAAQLKVHAAVHATACSSSSATPTARRSTTAGRPPAAAARWATAADGHEPRTRGKGPAGFDVRHRAVRQRRVRAAVGAGSPLAAGIGGAARRDRRRLAARGHRDAHDRAGRSRVFLQTGVNNGAPSWPNRIGSGRLDNPSVDLWFDPADFVAPPPNTYGDSGRGILYAPGPRQLRHVAVEAVHDRSGDRTPSSAGMRSTCSTIPASGSRTRTSASPTAGRITSTIGRQPVACSSR